MNKPLVYHAGPIRGLSYEAAVARREELRALLRPEIVTLSPMRGKESLRDVPHLVGPYPDDPMTAQEGIVARDRNDVRRSDLVLFDLEGALQVSIGTCAELAWADAYRKPAVLLMDDDDEGSYPAYRNPHHHPFVYGLTQLRVYSLAQAAEVIRKVLLP